MSIGLGIVLVVIGAILTFALNITVDWIDLQHGRLHPHGRGRGGHHFRHRHARTPPSHGRDVADDRRSVDRRPGASQRAVHARSTASDAAFRLPGPSAHCVAGLFVSSEPARVDASAAGSSGSGISGSAGRSVARAGVAQRDRGDRRGGDHERDPDQRRHDDPLVEGEGCGCRGAGRRSAGSCSATASAGERLASRFRLGGVQRGGQLDRGAIVRGEDRPGAVPSTAPSS